MQATHAFTGRVCWTRPKTARGVANRWSMAHGKGPVAQFPQASLDHFEFVRRSAGSSYDIHRHDSTEH